MKRWWGIRHLRYWKLKAELMAWFGMWSRAGIGLYVNPSDLDYLDRVWRGEL